MQDISRGIHDDSGGGGPGASVGRWAGAVLSIALIAGVGYWTYRLGQRDAMAVPVIQAMEGPARTQPDDPGGLRADHQGLTVTRIVEGERPPPRPTEMRTAPPTADLAAEDLPAASLAAPPVLASPPEAPAVSGPAVSGPVVPGPALSEPADPGPASAPLAATPDPAAPPLTRSLSPAAPAPAEIAEAEPPLPEPVAEAPEAEEAVVEIAATRRAPERAPRPAPRPARDIVEAAPAAPTPAPTPAAADRRDVAFPPGGTPLIQLGAFDSPEVAQAEWQRLVRAHGDLLGTKGPLIQRTQSSGRVFFRLRAEGFADLDDAKATCAALTARGPACIPARQE